MFIPIPVGEPIVLSLLLEGGETDQYPQATFFNTSGVSTVYDLSHVTMGRYEYEVPASGVSILGTYRAIYRVYTDAAHTLPNTNYYQAEDVFDVTDTDLSNLVDMITRVLGLTHENSYLDNATYDECNQLLACRLRCFDSKAHANAATAGGTETDGLVAMYYINSQYTDPGRLRSYKMTREL